MTQLSTKYIETALARGEKEEDIRETLRMQGIGAEDINKAFQEAKTVSKPTQPVAPTQPQPAQPSQTISPRQPLTSPPASGNSAFQNSGQSNQQPKESFQQEKKNENVLGGGMKVNLASRLSSEQDKAIPQKPTEEKSRIEYGKKSSKSLIVLSIIILLVAGIAYGAYYYKDDIMNFAGLGQSDVYDPEPLDTNNEPVVEEPTEEVETIEPAPIEEVVLTEDEKNMETIKATKSEIDLYYETESVYPQLSDLEEPNFYCYRKSGAHYILGTVLEEGNILLDSDLDGSYLCGDAVKDCADPVYCEGPETINN
ncbi:MAG: hypothetical protein K9M15_00495 [Candidatus Marinimicrobia bacterium]|nr:hypothetical protein [Candidatus Neomarinimicrobiota bacterium]